MVVMSTVKSDSVVVEVGIRGVWTVAVAGAGRPVGASAAGVAAVAAAAAAARRSGSWTPEIVRRKRMPNTTTRRNERNAAETAAR